MEDSKALVRKLVAIFYCKLLHEIVQQINELIDAVHNQTKKDIYDWIKSGKNGEEFEAQVYAKYKDETSTERDNIITEIDRLFANYIQAVGADTDFGNKAEEIRDSIDSIDPFGRRLLFIDNQEQVNVQCEIYNLIKDHLAEKICCLHDISKLYIFKFY